MDARKTAARAVRIGGVLGALTACAAGAWAHGLTLCVGTVNYSQEKKVSIDLRVGVGILHKYVDPDDDARITAEEWTSSSVVLEKLFASGIRLRSDDSSTTPSQLKLALTSGAEVQILATLDAPTTNPAVHLALPVLRRFPGAPPAQMSVWRGEQMVAPPELLWFDKELLVDRAK